MKGCSLCVKWVLLLINTSKLTDRHAYVAEQVVCHPLPGMQESIQLIKKGSMNRKHNSGLATVKLQSVDDVQRCCERLDGKVFQSGSELASGRPMIVRADKFECDQPGKVVASGHDTS